MANTADNTTSEVAAVLTDQDELSVDVTSDAGAVMRGVMEPLGRPIAKAAAVVGIAVVAIVGAGILSRVKRRGSTPLPQ
jgi:hypothetical protein